MKQICEHWIPNHGHGNEKKRTLCVWLADTNELYVIQNHQSLYFFMADKSLVGALVTLKPVANVDSFAFTVPAEVCERLAVVLTSVQLGKECSAQKILQNQI